MLTPPAEQTTDAYLKQLAADNEKSDNNKSEFKLPVPTFLSGKTAVCAAVGEDAASANRPGQKGNKSSVLTRPICHR